MAHFDKIGGYPNELKARFNSFIVTQFDDSLSVEMQLRSFIKWITETIDLVNDMVEYLNMFIEMFDKRLQEEIIVRLNIWLEDGTLADIINKDVFDMKVDREEFEAYQEEVDSLLSKLEKWVSDQLKDQNEKIEQQLKDQNEKIEQQLKDQNEFVEGKLESFDDRITQIVSINAYDVDPTGQSDSLQGFKNALNNLKDNETLVLDKNATYLLNDMLQIVKDGRVRIEGNGSTIYSNASQTHPDVDGRAVEFKGKFVNNKITTQSIVSHSDKINLNNTTGLKVGQLVYFQSSDQFNSSRNYYKKGGTFTITSVDSETQITISGYFPYTISSNCLVSVYDPITVEINNLNIVSLKQLPLGRFGLSVFYSKDSVIDNVFSDNFNHCIHLSTHYNTIVQRVKTGRSYYVGTSESYGLCSMIGTHLTIRNSVFKSGRHGLDISGRENSFNTTIENVSVFSESATNEIALNMHQASFGTTIRNSIMGSVGLANTVTVENCFIGGQGSSVIKTSEKHTETQYIFRSCRFSSEHIIRVTDDAQNQNNTANLVGLLKIEDCIAITKLQLSLAISDKNYRFYKVLINNTDNVETIFGSTSRVEEYIYKDSKFTADTNMLVQREGTGFLNNVTFDNMILVTRYDLITTTHFEKIEFLNCFIQLRDGETSRTNMSSKDGDVHRGRVLLLNTDLTNLQIQTAGWDYLTLVNSEIDFYSGASSVQNKIRSTMESFQ